MKNYSEIADSLARVGYETMFDISWEELHPKSIERSLWREIALNMIKELWRQYENEKL